MLKQQQVNGLCLEYDIIPL